MMKRYLDAAVWTLKALPRGMRRVDGKTTAEPCSGHASMMKSRTLPGHGMFISAVGKYVKMIDGVELSDKQQGRRAVA